MSNSAECGTSYAPGQMNINQREARARRETGFLSTFAGFIFFAFLAVLQAPTVAYVLVFPFSWSAVISFLQSSRFFCVRFAIKGVHNAHRDTDIPQRIVSESALVKDREKARQLIVLTTLFSGIITSTAVVVAATILNTSI